MSLKKSLFLATHPRSASTAFERSFMSRNDTITIHEPFGEPFYYGPERLSDRYNQYQRTASGCSNITFAEVFNDIQDQANPEKYLFIKDMAQYVIPPPIDGKNDDERPARANPEVASSFGNDPHSESNPTVLPDHAVVGKFEYVILIRAPHLSIPSYYTCCIPPRSEKTGFDHFRSSEAGYRELRILYDYLKLNGITPLVIDAEDLSVDPEQVLAEVCKQVAIPFDKSMLKWDANDHSAVDKFAKWAGFHDDALKSTGFTTSSNKSDANDGNHSAGKEFAVDWSEWERQWKAKFDQKGVDIIKQSVSEHLDDYLYLRKFKYQLQ